MKIIIHPCDCEVFGSTYPAFVAVEFSRGRLSVHGVIGPRRNGDCNGSCGQCYDEISKGIPAVKWNQEMLDKLIMIWKTWHLNDSRPYCNHQKELGWDRDAVEMAKIYHYHMNREALSRKKKAEDASLFALQRGETFTPTLEQVKFASMQYSLNTPEELGGKLAEYYEPTCKIGGSKVEEKLRGWLSYNEHPLGLIGKPCPVCGYGYGSKWLREEVPKDVVDWLKQLPKTDLKPAWV